ncbi:MAG: NUDIX hydrolase [Pirellulales bacterium]
MSSRIKRRETLLTASRFRVDRVTYDLENGGQATKEVIQHPGAVVIVPVVSDGRICLIQNYRVAVDREMIELPAGTLEPGEPPLETARRELIEETGYRAAEIKPMMDLLMSPGILYEHMYVFVATELEFGEPDLEHGEEIRNMLVSPEEARELIRTNLICDSKTVSALLYYFSFLTT